MNYKEKEVKVYDDSKIVSKLKSYIERKKIRKIYKQAAQQKEREYFLECESQYSLLKGKFGKKDSGYIEREDIGKGAHRVIVYTDHGPIMKIKKPLIASLPMSTRHYEISYCGYMPDEVFKDYKYVTTSCKYHKEDGDIADTEYKTSIRVGKGSYTTEIKDEYVKRIHDNFAEYFAISERNAVTKAKDDLFLEM